MPHAIVHTWTKNVICFSEIQSSQDVFVVYLKTLGGRSFKKYQTKQCMAPEILASLGLQCCLGTGLFQVPQGGFPSSQWRPLHWGGCLSSDPRSPSHPLQGG